MDPALAYPKYDAYMGSGVAWLGDIPSHWQILPFQALFQMSVEKNGKEIVGEMLSVSGYRGIEVKHYEHEEQKRSAEDLVDYRVVRPGQLVVNTMWLNYAGLGVSDYEGHVSPAYRSYNMSDQLHGRYAHYLLRSHVYVEGYTGQMQGIRPNSLQIKNCDFNKFPVLIPEFGEQERIANFLDRKTAEIDEAIAKKQRLIELLKEQKAILINQAVTKGLNPGAPMRDSGVEWIGEVPKHWEVKRVKNVASFITSGPRGWADYFTDDGAFFLQSGNLTNSASIDLGKANRVTPPKGAEGKRTLLQHGDVLVCITGANTGRVAIAVFGDEVVYINQHLCLIRATEKIVPRYLAHCLLSSVGKTHFFLQQYGLKEGLGLDDIKNAPVLAPPKKEQVAISERISKVIEMTDTASDGILSHIAALSEFKSTIIAQAVTGKIKL